MGKNGEKLGKFEEKLGKKAYLTKFVFLEYSSSLLVTFIRFISPLTLIPVLITSK